MKLGLFEIAAIISLFSSVICAMLFAFAIRNTRRELFMHQEWIRTNRKKLNQISDCVPLPEIPDPLEEQTRPGRKKTRIFTL